MKPKVKKPSTKVLSDKIADALTVKARADVEDDHVFGTKPKTISRADLASSDSEDETAISDFRKRNVNLLSELSKKYEGEVISRKNLGPSLSESDYESDENSLENNGVDQSKTVSDEDEDDIEDPGMKLDSGSSSDDYESDDYSITQAKRTPKHKAAANTSDDDDSNEESDQDESDEDNDQEGLDISQLEQPELEEFEHVKKQNISEEAKKGACVRNQLLLWENLLETRIHLQRCLNTANQMPLPDTYEEMKSNSLFREENNAVKNNISTALEKLLTLQSLMLKQYPETKSVSSIKTASTEINAKKPTLPDNDEEILSDEEIPSDTESEAEDIKEHKKEEVKTKTRKRKLQDYEKDIAVSHKSFKGFRDGTIQKWNEKTRLATVNTKNTPTNTVLQQISYILSDKNKLIKKTQLKRTDYDIIGYKNDPFKADDISVTPETDPLVRDRKDDDEYIPEIFDDSDFYHQLLRELIECKSADISDPVQLSRQWIALQQMRSKMKRKVDTKATKGRKIKYVVHNQLVNYMAPEKGHAWTDESANELYSSLFGKLYEQNNVGLNADLDVFKLK